RARRRPAPGLHLPTAPAVPKPARPPLRPGAQAERDRPRARQHARRRPQAAQPHPREPPGVPAAQAAGRSAVTPDDDRIQRLLHGLATEEERRELDRLLSTSPEAAEAFARASRLDQALD